MFKKLMALVLVALFVMSFGSLITPAICHVVELQSKWLKGTGGAIFSYGQLQKAKFNGIFNAEGLIRLKGDKLYGGVQYRDINNEGLSFDDLTVKTYLYTRDLNASIEKRQPQMYLMLGGGGAHESKSGTFAVASVNGGFGLLIPTGIANFIVELTGFNIMRPNETDVSSILFTAGIQANLGFLTSP